MKIVFVVGGSYKWFYLNKLNKIKKIDLLIFHQNIFYKLDCDDILNNDIIFKEIIYLNNILKCPICVCGILNKNGINQKIFIVCVKGKISLINCNKDIYLYIRNKLIVISTRFCKYSKAFALIEISNNSNMLQKSTKNRQKNHFICCPRGVLYVCDNKIYRKIRKCCYFTLNLKRKML